MPSPKTWDLLGGFVTALEGIAISDGYYTDAGDHVLREVYQIPEDGEPSIVVVLESLQRPEEQAMRNLRAYLATVVVTARVPTGQSDAQQRLHELIDDVHRALHQRADLFPAMTQAPRLQDVQILAPVEGMKWIGAELRYAAHVIPR